MLNSFEYTFLKVVFVVYIFVLWWPVCQKECVLWIGLNMGEKPPRLQYWQLFKLYFYFCLEAKTNYFILSFLSWRILYYELFLLDNWYLNADILAAWGLFTVEMKPRNLQGPQASWFSQTSMWVVYYFLRDWRDHQYQDQYFALRFSVIFGYFLTDLVTQASKKQTSTNLDMLDQMFCI